LFPFSLLISHNSNLHHYHDKKINVFPQLLVPSVLFKFSRTKANSLLKLDVYGCNPKLPFTLEIKVLFLFKIQFKIVHLWQLKISFFLHRYLICTVSIVFFKSACLHFDMSVEWIGLFKELNQSLRKRFRPT
jgi:hypothetical protein